MDIKFDIDENNRFNFRVAAVIKNKDKILVSKNINADYYSLLGGRVSLGEDSISALLREMKEETNLDCKHIKSLAVVENFFTSSYNGKKYHEILFIHELEFIDKNVYNQEHIDVYEEFNKDHYIYKWMSTDELKKVKYEPSIVLDLINKDFSHQILKDY